MLDSKTLAQRPQGAQKVAVAHGKAASRPSGPVHCPLVTECHSPPLPYGCQGNWQTAQQQGAPSPAHTPQKPPDHAGRKGKAGYSAGKEEVREAGPPQLVSFPLLSPKKALTFLAIAQGGHGRHEDSPVAAGAPPESKLTTAPGPSPPALIMSGEGTGSGHRVG